MKTNTVVRLSQSSTEMFNSVTVLLRENKFKVLDFPIFFYILLATVDELGNRSTLDSYLFKEGADEASVATILNVTLNSTINLQEKQKQSYKVINFVTHQNRSLSYLVTDEMEQIMEKLKVLIGDFSLTEVEPIHFTTATFMAELKDFKDFFKNLGLSYSKARKYFEPNHILKLGVPIELDGILSNVNDIVEVSKPCEVLMRNDEISKLWSIMQKKDNHNAILLGDVGVGKTALVERITYEINAGTCPKEFAGFKVISLDVNALIAKFFHSENTDECIACIIKFFETHPKSILFIDDIHVLLEQSMTLKGGIDFTNTLRLILSKINTIVIGATTYMGYYYYFLEDTTLYAKFEVIEILPPKAKNIYPMIKNKVQALSNFHGVKITKRTTEYIAMLANCVAFEKVNPNKTLDLIDRAMVIAKQAQKKHVDKTSILKSMDVNLKMWNAMDDDSKKATAYHEAGHYVVGKASGNLTANDWMAVSIIPFEHYLGITSFEMDEYANPVYNMDYFIDELALDLAGRIAEEKVTNCYTAGASSDLDNATRRAFQVVSSFGMSSEFVGNRSYINSANYPMFSEKVTDMLNDEVDELIERAYNRAEELLEENEDILEAIAAALLEKQIMSEVELDKIWQEVVNKRKK